MHTGQPREYYIRSPRAKELYKKFGVQSGVFRSEERRGLAKERFGKAAYQLYLPQWDFGAAEGERLLCLFNYVPNECFENQSSFEHGDLRVSGEAEFVQNLVHKVLEENSKKAAVDKEFALSTMVFAHYRQFFTKEDAEEITLGKLEEDSSPPEGLLEEGQGLPQPDSRKKKGGEDVTLPMHKFFTDELSFLIEDYRPTRILLLDEKLFPIWNYYYLNNKNLNSLEHQEPLLFMGRVFNTKIEGLGYSIPTSFTISTSWTVTNSPKLRDSTPFLAHQQKFHLETLLYGKSRYEVTKPSSWAVKDIMSIEDFDAFYEKLIINKITCVDIETTGLFKIANRILTMHFALGESEAYNLPYQHAESPFGKKEIDHIATKLKYWFENGTSDYLIFHNGKFDLGFFYKQLNIEFCNHRVVDTTFSQFMLDENQKEFTKIGTGVYNLRHMSFQYGSRAYEEGALGKASRKTLESESLKDIFEYAAKDVIIPYQIYQFQKAEARRRGYQGWDTFVENQGSAMVHTFANMETRGVLVDTNYLQELCSSDSKINKLLAEIKSSFKLNENCQTVNAILLAYDKCKENFQAASSSLTKFKRWLDKVDSSPGKGKVGGKTKAKVKHLTLSLFETEEDSADIDNCLLEVGKLQAELSDEIASVLAHFKSDIAMFRQLANRLTTEGEEGIEELRLLRKGLRRFTELLSLIKAHFEKSFRGTEEVKSFLESSLSTPLPQLLPSEAEFKGADQWKFDILKKDSQQLLFFDVLGLSHVDTRKDGGGAIGTAFQKVYSAIPEVQSFSKFQEYSKLINTYIEGMLSRIYGKRSKEGGARVGEDLDAQADGCLRAQYQFTDVVTGRSGCVRGDMKILTDLGEIEISRVVKERIKCNVLTHKGNWMPVVDWIYSGQKKVYKVTAESGKVVYTTNCHPYLTKDGWKPLKDLSVGCMIMVVADACKF